MLTLIKIAAAIFVTLLVQCLPLVGAYHYESALSIALVGVLFVPIITPRRDQASQFWFSRACAVTLLYWILANIVAVIVAWLRNDLCDLAAGLHYQLLIPLPALLLSTAVWGWSASLSRFGSVRVLSYLLVVALDFGFALYALYQWPPLVAFGHFFGYFAGSIYDEAINVQTALCLYRVGTLVVMLCFLFAQRQGIRLWKRLSLAMLALIFAAGYHVALATLEHIPPMGRGALQTTLWQSIEAQDGAWIVHYRPHARNAAERLRHENQLRSAYERDFRLLEQFFQTRPSAPIHIWLYPTYDTKARFLAARNTSFARVWKHEIHLVESDPFSTTPRHEMAHLFAETFGNRPLGLAGAWGIPAMGWVEGLAMAAEWPFDAYDLHTWSAALLSQSQTAPLSPLGLIYGFWSMPPRAAYTLVGSYVRWLVDTYGMDKVKRLSQSSPGQFDDIIADDFYATFRAWQTFLRQKQDKRANALAELVFSTRSIWTKSCARASASQNQAFYRCLNDMNCSDATLDACAQPADTLPALERDWQRYMAEGPLQSAFPHAASDRRTAILQKLDALDTEAFSPLETLIWDERRADMLWHGGWYVPAAFAYRAILSRPLPKNIARRIEIKHQAALYANHPVSADIRRWFAETDEETKQLLYMKSGHAPVMAWLALVNAISERRYEHAQYALMQIWLHYGNPEPATALPQSSLADLIHIMSHMPADP